MSCYSTDHNEAFRNESAIYKYNFSTNLGIQYDLDTAIGFYDNTGITVEFYSNKYYCL